MPGKKGAFSSCILLAALVPLFFHGCRNEAFLRTSFSPPPSAQKCAGCHDTIFLDWLRSAHRDAWSDEDYMNGLAETGTSACSACHAPEVLSLLDGTRPVLRESNLMEGVNCLACHGADCPKVIVEDPGASRFSRGVSLKDDTSGLCRICHVSTYEEWLEFSARRETGEKTPGCVECHMQGHDLGQEQPPDPEAIPSHAFLPRYEDSVHIEVTSIEETASGGWDVELVLNCRRAGHRIPTGDYGFREVRLEVWLDDIETAEIHFKRFFVEMGNALEPGRNGPFRFSLEHPGETLSVRVRRLGMHGKQVAILGSYDLGR